MDEEKKPVPFRPGHAAQAVHVDLPLMVELFQPLVALRLQGCSYYWQDG
jgi:hypothetical protein